MTDETLDARSIDVATLAWLAGSAANEYLLARIRERGHASLRISHGYVFQHLIDRSPTIGELAESLDMTQQGASKAVVELESLGYVRRIADQHDSRVRRVRLTKQGSQAVRDARAARQAMEKELVSSLGPDVVAAARTVLVALLSKSEGGSVVARRAVKPAPAS